MPRYMQDYMLLEPPEKTWAVIQQHFTGKGYEYKDFEGEMVFQKGNGWITAPTFVKVAYYTDRVRVEIWIKNALLPYLYVGEIGIEGFYGWAVKGKMKDAALMLDQLFGGPAARIGCNSWLQQNGPRMSVQQTYLNTGNVAQGNVYCAKCGAALSQGSRFCPNCGSAQ